MCDARRDVIVQLIAGTSSTIRAAWVSSCRCAGEKVGQTLPSNVGRRCPQEMKRLNENAS
jgi:hypothetical protein